MDRDQEAAVRVDANAVVSAGAGSGKTTVLAERYLRLVQEGRAGVESILTLTFTRKAAAEMHDRIYRRLLSQQQDPRVAQNLPHFDRAQISTLDSFCGQIARADCARFGIPPDFSTDEERVATLVEETAMEFLLVNRRHRVLVDLVEQNGFEKVWRECMVPLGLDYFHVSAVTDFAAMLRNQENRLTVELQETYRKVDGLRSSALGLDPGAGRRAAELVAWFEGLSDWRECLQSGDLGRIDAEARVPGRINLSGRATREDLIVAKEIIQELRILCTAVQEMVGSIRLLPQSGELFRLVADYEETLRRGKQSQALLSFTDVMGMAVAILRDNLELRRYYQKRFSHILIDEFQDNNALQRDLLFLLSSRAEHNRVGAVPQADELEPGKLFFVGDEKQSIYLFRGADVSVFKGLSAEIAGTGGSNLSLRTNYRSHPALIRFFNSIFPAVMEPSGRPFEADFEPLGERDEDPDGVEPVIKFFYKPFETGGEDAAVVEPLQADDAEAYTLAHFIHSSVQGDPPLMIQAGGRKRPATFDDFAILLRSGSNQIRYERMLRAFDIPYTSQTIRSLFLEAPLNDLYAALQLVVYPYDRTAYAALLRSPLVHLSDDGFARVLLACDRPFEPCELPDPDAGRYELGRRLYRHLCDLADRIPIVDLLRTLWYDFGYRYTLLRDPAYHTYLEYFDYFCALAERSGAPTLAGFLDVVRPHLGRYEKLPELSVLHEQVRGVQIMTIHKSKGLEFPVVILANTGNTGRAEGVGSRPYYLHPEYGLTFNLIPERQAAVSAKRVNYFYSLGKTEREQRELAELKRLLYVGMTRAQSHLIISGVHHKNNRKSESALLNLFLHGAEALGAGTAGFTFETEEIPDVASAEFFRRRARIAAPDLQAAFELYRAAESVDRTFARSRATVTELNSERAVEVPGGEVQTLPAIESDSIIEEKELEGPFGTLCHLVLQRRIERTVTAAVEFDERLLREAGLGRLADALDPDAIRTLAEDAWRLADGFLASSTAHYLDGALSVDTEVPFVLRRIEDGNELLVHGQIDLLVHRPERIIIVDFKTEKALRDREFDMQLELYRDAAPDLVDGGEGLPVLSMLYYLRGGEVREGPGATSEEGSRRR